MNQGTSPAADWQRARPTTETFSAAPFIQLPLRSVSPPRPAEQRPSESKRYLLREMDDLSGTGERLVRVQLAALELAEVVEDLVLDMETIALNMPERTKRTHELALAKRARELARAVRAAVADTRQAGALERRRLVTRRQDPPAGSAAGATERRSGEAERRQRDRRRQ